MKLTKQEKKELLQVYETWWNSYLTGDVKTYDSFLTDDYRFVGSTDGEEYLNRKDTTAFFEATADQLAGKAELRNLKRTIDELEGGVILITDLADAYVVSEPEWVFYSRFRFTSMMRKTVDGWRFFYQHFSAPDTKAQEGETLGTEKITKENQELRDAIKRRTKELEYKNQELEIEAALEKVRAVAMGMNKPDDLAGICKIVFDELVKLGFDEIRNSLINTYNDEQQFFDNYDYSTFSGSTSNRIPYSGNFVIETFIKSIRSSSSSFSELKVSGKQLTDWKNFRKENNEVDDPRLNNLKALYYYNYSVSEGSIGISTFSSINEQKLTVLRRFRNVFDLAYQRYVDITLAEAQAREAQIEAALERVRSRSLAMHKSDELQDVIIVVSEQLQLLQFRFQNVSFCVNNEHLGLNFWLASPGQAQPFLIEVPYLDNPALYRPLQARNKGVDFITDILTPEENQQWLRHIFIHSVLKNVSEENKEYFLSTGGFARSIVLMKNILLTIGNYGPVPYTDEQNDILKRVGHVFDQAYTRFLDLQKAEAQAREAQIEAALERVRSKAMAMHSSEDLAATVDTYFTELNNLNVTPRRCGVGIINAEARLVDIHATTATGDNEVKKMIGNLTLTGHPVLENIYNHWIEQKEYHPILKGNEISTYYKAMNPEVKFPDFPEDEIQYGYYFFFKEGGVFAWTDKELTESELQIFRRYTSVLSLTYRRYMDLMEAEAQAKEANIEAALERVRAHTMAMNKSNDLRHAVSAIFKELDKLDLKTLRCGIGIINEGNKTVNVWTTTATDDGNDISFSGNESMDVHPVLQGAFESWKIQQDFFYTLEGEDLISYYHTMGGENYKLPAAATGVNVLETDKHYYYCTYFSDGGLYFFSEFPFTEELVRVIRRFAKAFSLAYKRFEDLKLSEEQAYKAKIEVALERVRARALAMQEPEELKEVAEVLRHEMGLLGVEELETCSIYINDEAIQRTECWYALKDIREEEKKLVSDHFSLNLTVTWVGREMLKFYKSDEKQVSIVMQGANRKEWIRYCEEKSVPFRGYYGEEIPDRTYHLFKFSHGAIGAAAAGDISAESWDLLRRAASVFSLAYSRFKDLTQARIDLVNLKEEKQKAEDALTILKATQSQLIQSEKLASLGELTAGIAHEIQNPLNFVNNFAEVNRELIDEMEKEIDKGDMTEVKALAKDIKGNEEKILHHGKRADAIVKGMLQHSRSSGGTKEPTDINALADEYLRLAYHGLRAKDKSFNATMNTDFDSSIGKINVIPQDIGRVILNLITNAFYAVTEKKKETGGDYEPTVTVSTKRVASVDSPLGARGGAGGVVGGHGDMVEVSVKDNGNGIPQKILDKIFQPFFTTKPTGQGTGLGLSLAYDIVKAHGGELRVETQEGEGSEFIIELPVNS